MERGDRFEWNGKEMYLGYIAEVSITSKGKKNNIHLKKQAEYDSDQLTFVPVEGPDTPDTRLSLSYFEARNMLKRKHLKRKEEQT